MDGNKERAATSAEIIEGVKQAFYEILREHRSLRISYLTEPIVQKGISDGFKKWCDENKTEIISAIQKGGQTNIFS